MECKTAKIGTAEGRQRASSRDQALRGRLSCVPECCRPNDKQPPRKAHGTGIRPLERDPPIEYGARCGPSSPPPSLLHPSSGLVQHAAARQTCSFHLVRHHFVRSSCHSAMLAHSRAHMTVVAPLAPAPRPSGSSSSAAQSPGLPPHAATAELPSAAASVGARGAGGGGKIWAAM